MNVAISGSIQPKVHLACYHPELKETSCIWEQVIVGYLSVIMFEYEDGMTSYDTVLFATEKQAKKHLSTQYTKLF